jgi:hypothetical protein
MSGSTRTALMAESRDLETLLESPGWKRYRIAADVKLAAYHGNLEDLTGDAALRAQGRVKELKELVDWPVSRLKAIQKELENERGQA